MLAPLPCAGRARVLRPYEEVLRVSQVWGDGWACANLKVHKSFWLHAPGHSSPSPNRVTVAQAAAVAAMQTSLSRRYALAGGSSRTAGLRVSLNQRRGSPGPYASRLPSKPEQRLLTDSHIHGPVQASLRSCTAGPSAVAARARLGEEARTSIDPQPKPPRTEKPVAGTVWPVGCTDTRSSPRKREAVLAGPPATAFRTRRAVVLVGAQVHSPEELDQVLATPGTDGTLSRDVLTHITCPPP